MARLSGKSIGAAPPAREEYVPYDELEELLGPILDDRVVEFHAARSSGDYLDDERALMLTALSRAGNRLVLAAPERHGATVTPAPSRATASK